MEDIKIDSEFCYRAKKVIQRFPNRALDLLHCFSPSQEKSKRWLLTCLRDYLNSDHKILEIAILGSWYGYLAYLIKDILNDKLITEIRCYDIDDTAKKIGRMMFRDKTFIFQTLDVSTINFQDYKYNIVINTSCEHMSNDAIHHWLFTARKNTTCVLQSTNKYARDHCNMVENENELVENFKEHFSEYKSFTLNFDNYSRFMIIGTKK